MTKNHQFGIFWNSPNQGSQVGSPNLAGIRINVEFQWNSYDLSILVCLQSIISCSRSNVL